MIEVGLGEAKGQSLLYSRSLRYRFWFMSRCESSPGLFGLRTRLWSSLANIMIAFWTYLYPFLGCLACTYLIYSWLSTKQTFSIDWRGMRFWRVLTKDVISYSSWTETRLSRFSALSPHFCYVYCESNLKIFRNLFVLHTADNKCG